MSDTGDFAEWEKSSCACEKCGKRNVLTREWESSDGGHEDYQYKCQETDCGHDWWVDGVDS